jgi:mannose-1-phosphate guanylyltransferase/mannose-1-phosphate guanylyltransferase/mannose-6-phosphate isomerase
VLGFVEKPSFQTAEQYLKSGSYYWNGGIFLFEAQTLIEELELFADDVASACRIAVATSSIDGDFLRPGKAAFLACRSIAIDRAVMEKTNRASVVPVDMSWSDLGSWEALWEISAKDEAKNAVFGDVITSGSSGSLIRSEGAATVAALGVQDLVIVATEDAVLVTRRERAQDVGSFVDTLRGAEHHHLLESPPQPVSGTDQAAGSGAGVQTRHITLVSGEKLVPERNCSVHWIVVSGTAQITYDQTNIVLRENESTFLPASTELQIENSGAVPLHLVEVQIGSSRERD